MQPLVGERRGPSSALVRMEIYGTQHQIIEMKKKIGAYGTELYDDSVKLGICDGQETEENKEDDEERREEDRKISSCSTFSNETLDELSQRFPANLSGLSEQYRDISTDSDNTIDTAYASVSRVLNTSHIRHLVLNNQYSS